MFFRTFCVSLPHVWYLVKMDGEKNHRRKRKRTFISIFYIYIYVHVGIFFSIRVFFHGHWRLTGQQGKRGTIFYSNLPLPPSHKHSDIYLQYWMWDDYHMFLIVPLVFTRLLTDEIYHLIEISYDWLMMRS